MSKKKKKLAERFDCHYLYEASVQTTAHAIDFMRRVYRRRNGEPMRVLREDFCGTAKLACDWVRRHRNNRAVGIDLDGETLHWARAHHLPYLTDDQRQRVQLVEGDVRQANVPVCDVVCAFNFSYFIFKQRERLKAYLQSVRRGLGPGGLFVCDIYGGSGAFGPLREERIIAKERHDDGTRTPAFTYRWEHAAFNAATHEVEGRISFIFKDRSTQRRAYVYDWRLWTVPEMVDLLTETGFSDPRVYTHGWDENGESDDCYRPRSRFDNEEGWLAYIVGSVG